MPTMILSTYTTMVLEFRKKTKKKIFEKFERASAIKQTRKGGPSGFGLGLNYVYQVMEAHEGRVYINSIEGNSVNSAC